MMYTNYKKDKKAFDDLVRGFRKKGSKYGAIKTKVGDITFDSKGEAKRYQELLLLLRAGEISDLKLQVGYDLIVEGTKICKYVADFTYLENHKRIVEDFKGVRTAVYRLKKKLMKAILGIEIRETGK